MGARLQVGPPPRPDTLIGELREELGHPRQAEDREVDRFVRLEDLKNRQRPLWMIMTVIPVIPPDSSVGATGRATPPYLNDLYRRGT